MILFILGVIDLIGSIIVFLTLTKAQVLVSIGSPIAIFLIAKGIFSLSTHEKSLFAAMVDICCAIVVALSAFGIFIHYMIVIILGLLLFLKSVQSLLPEVLS